MERRVPSRRRAMRRIICLLAGVLLVVSSLGSDSPKGYDDKTENGGIEAPWRLIETEYKDRKWKAGRQDVMTLRSGIYTGKDSEGETVRGDYRIDPTRTPSTLDWIPSKGQTVIRFIFQIDGDTLRIAGIPDEIGAFA